MFTYVYFLDTRLSQGIWFHSICILELVLFLRSRVGAVVITQWWMRSPSTNVSRVRFPDPASYVDWVCWFSTLLREVFLRVLRFSPLLKNQRWFDWFDLIYLIYSLPLCLARMIWDLIKLLLLLFLSILIINLVLVHFITNIIHVIQSSDCEVFFFNKRFYLYICFLLVCEIGFSGSSF